MMTRDWVLGRVRRARRWSMVASVALALLAGCGPDDLVALRAHGDASDAAAMMSRANEPQTKSQQQASVRAATLSAQMKTAASDVRYAIVPGDDAPLVAKSASRGIEGHFDERGVALSSGSASAGWSGRLDVVGYGCATDGKLAEVTSGAPVRDANDANRLSYERRAGTETFVETWANGEPGLEQTFTVERTPCSASAGGGTAWFEIDAGGLTPELVAATADKTAEVLLRDGVSGRVRAHYSDAYAEDATGRAVPVVMDVNGGRVVIDVDVAGARFPVRVDPVVWVQQGGPLVVPDGAAGDYFGQAVSVSGDTALVGDYYAATAGGVAYVFTRTGTTWAPHGVLASGGGIPGEHFGYSVSVSGDTALVGAYGHNGASGTDQGTAYVFLRSGTTWARQGALVATDGDPGEEFGYSVSVSGDTALVGAPGLVGHGLRGAYVFARSGTTWAQQGAPLVPTDGAAGDEFGYSVSVSGGTTLVGAPGHSEAYVFVRSGTTWAQQGAPLIATDGAAGDEFGYSVSVSGDTALVGALKHQVGEDADQGAVYVFVRSGTTWAQQGVPLVATDGAAGDEFGYSVSASGDTATIGAAYHQVAANVDQGAAYVFARSGTTWAQQGVPLVATDGATGDEFGNSVSVSGDTAMVGAANHQVYANVDQGEAYVFVLIGAPCTSSSQCGSGFCHDGVCCNTACPGSCDVCAATLGATAEGICTTAPAGYAGNPTCAPQACNGTSTGCVACTADGQCAAGLYCAANGSCRPQKAHAAACNDAAGKDCLSGNCRVCAAGAGFCQDGFCCNTTCAYACDVCAASAGATADGTCTTAPLGSNTTACAAPYVCDGTSVTCASGPGGCAADADCSTGFFCSYNGSVGKCLAQKPLAATCNTGQGGDCVAANCRVCQSGFCATGVCCQTACDQPCAACSGAGGTCLAAAKGSPGAPSCGEYVCDGTNLACPTTCTLTTDCANGFTCVNGACIGANALGTGCTQDAECSSGFCADGVCCDTACNGQCEWCGDPSNSGTCEATPVGPPMNGRQACSGSGACLGQCNGAKRDGCTYPGNATQCAPATCVNDSIITASTCDTAGNCAAGNLQDCGGYTCDPSAGACKTVCATKADCRLGAVCDTSSGTGTCNAAGATCVGGFSVKASDGAVTPCPDGYQCLGAGECQQQCGTSADCAPGYDCTASSCVATGTGAGGASSSGGAMSASAGGASTAIGGTTSASAGGASTTNTGGTPTTNADAGAQPKNGTGGAAGTATSKDAGGCGCRVPRGRGGQGNSAGAAGLALAAVVLGRRRVRTGRRAPCRG